MAQAGDQPATCAPPAGGDTCSPGSIGCGGSACAVPANECCEVSSATPPDTCVAAGTSCGGTAVSCNEAADCAVGEICCIASQNTTTAVVSCQRPVDGKCPTALVANAQICRSNAECPGGACNFWNCLHNVIEACSNPVPNLAVCTISEADGGPPGSGSGS